MLMITRHCFNFKIGEQTISRETHVKFQSSSTILSRRTRTCISSERKRPKLVDYNRKWYIFFSTSNGILIRACRITSSLVRHRAVKLVSVTFALKCVFSVWLPLLLLLWCLCSYSFYVHHSRITLCYGAKIWQVSVWLSWLHRWIFPVYAKTKTKKKAKKEKNMN